MVNFDALDTDSDGRRGSVVRSRVILIVAAAISTTSCFSDPSPVGEGDSEGTSSTSASTTAMGTTSIADDDGTDVNTTDEADATAENSGPSTSSSASTDGTGSSASSTGGNDDCTPVEVEVPGEFAELEVRVIDLDFDEFPGMPGEGVELCRTFTSDNAASARTITIGGVDGELLGLGPCGSQGPAPGPFGGCSSFVKPEGIAEVIIDNTTSGPGCQNGGMTDLVFQFGCLQAGGSE